MALFGCTVLNRVSVMGHHCLSNAAMRHVVQSRSAISADIIHRHRRREEYLCLMPTCSRHFSTIKPATQKETVRVHFKFPDGTTKTAVAKVGDNLLDTVLSNNLDIDGYGACEGTLACSTCHLVFKEHDFAKLPQKPTDEELDMLDLAYGLSDTSRLGCQVIVTKDMDGWEVKVPGGTADARG